jgi:hypothetical protein
VPRYNAAKDEHICEYRDRLAACIGRVSLLIKLLREAAPYVKDNEELIAKIKVVVKGRIWPDENRASKEGQSEVISGGAESTEDNGK